MSDCVIGLCNSDSLRVTRLSRTVSTSMGVVTNYGEGGGYKTGGGRGT